MAMPTNIVQIVSSYNKSLTKTFSRKNAERVFLGVFDMSLESKIPDKHDLQKKINSLQDGQALALKSLHFIKYKITNETNNKRKERIWEHYVAIRNYLATNNVGLVYSFVASYIRKKPNTEHDKDNMISLGFSSLLDCIDRFDPWKGFQLSTYVYRSIYLRFARPVFKPLFFTDSISDYTNTYKDQENNNELIDIMKELMSTNLLNQNELTIINKRFFDKHLTKKTLHSIGQEIGLSKERVRQIQKNGIEKLKHKMQHRLKCELETIEL